jgi:hypothetical protein
MNKTTSPYSEAFLFKGETVKIYETPDRTWLVNFQNLTTLGFPTKQAALDWFQTHYGPIARLA